MLTDPESWLATEVPRQKRILPSAAGTVSEVAAQPSFDVVQLTVNRVPVRAFSGRPPSAGGLKRGSRQVPVQTFGVGSVLAFALVSLYETSVR